MDNVPKIGQYRPFSALYLWTVLDELHTRIRQAREKTGLSQEKMAEELGVGRTTYINFETGRSRLINPLLESMATLLGTTTEELLFGPRPDAQLLQDRAALEEWRDSLVAEYEKRYTALEEQLKAANQIINAQETTIRTLTDTNQFLMKQLRKED